MVDLVKIRKKKAKEKAQAEAAAPAENSGAAAAPAAEEFSQKPEELRTPEEPDALKPAAPQTTADAQASHKPAAEAAAAPLAAISKLERFKQEAGKRREFTEVHGEDVAPADQLELLTFVIAGEQYAVDIERIIEIVTPRPVTRVPNADPSVVGIISLRGTIVTLVDVRRKLRHRAAGDADPDTRIVVIDFQHELVGFIVDRVLRVVKTASGLVEPHPVVHATELDDSIRGVFHTGGALTILLDLDKLLDHRALAAPTA